MNDADNIIRTLSHIQLEPGYILGGMRRVRESNVCFSMTITYQGTQHRVDLQFVRGTLMWLLTPYADSFFTTQASVASFDMVLLAIYEHRTIHLAHRIKAGA